MELHHIPITKTARYTSLGLLNEDTESIWFVCHGYGQLAEYFIPKFKILDNGKNFIVAPEALSRFYLEGYSGKVGAVWMTKEDRLNDIQDNINYLNILYTHVIKNVSHKPAINILGFSQGVATACRWVADGLVKPERLILWAGLFPPELNYDFIFQPELIKSTKTYVIYGSNDPFLKEEHLHEIEQYRKNYNDLKIIMFDGKHQLDDSILKNFLDSAF